jgi:hypothetical protein
MHLAYVDESGDRGVGGSRTYTLGCVLVRASQWADAFDGVIGFRRFLKSTLGVPVRAELKANHLLRNAGALQPLALSEHARYFIYRGLLRLQQQLQLSTFAIVINKSRLHANVDPFVPAWTYLIQRLERLSTNNNGEEVLIVHDEGEVATIRTLARKARRAGTAGSLFGGYLNVPFTRLLDDPVSRDSKQSYFLQLADLNAYAAFRRVYPPPARAVKIVPTLMWNELGNARYAAANMRAGGPSPGIVLWPRPA